MPRKADSNDDVTGWVRSVENGDAQAAADLWEYCFPRLLNYSRKKLPDHLRRVLDEEDVALSAFKSFCLARPRGPWETSTAVTSFGDCCSASAAARRKATSGTRPA